MSQITPPDSTNTELFLYKLRDPTRPVQSNLNYYLSTISSYIPKSRPISWLKIPISWLHIAINSIFRFIYGSPKTPKLEEASTYAYLSKDVNSFSIRAEIFKETKQALDQGYYYLPDGTKITLNLDPMKEGTKVYTHKVLNKSLDLTGRPKYDTTFEIINEDTIIAGLKLLEEGLDPLCLNMAHSFHPGGGVKQGCPAQEEELCRKSGLYFSLKPADNPHINAQMAKGYLIPEHGCIYSPKVPIIRERKADHFAWLETPKQLSFVSSAAYDLRSKSKDRNLSKADFEKGMRLKIQSQIMSALEHRHDSLVLGAFGCGAFEQNPEMVSQWYAEELAPYKKFFKKISFAVLVLYPKDQANFDAFQKRFS